MIGMKENPSVKRRVHQKSILLLWFCNAVTKYLLSFIGSVESFVLVPSLARRTTEDLFDVPSRDIAPPEISWYVYMVIPLSLVVERM